ncbi:transcription termination factor MTERF8, chloroplastic [Elaeis guineensis]|uniref:Transcription termination factor MTERF15, mitochondrial n=1 Tax=Elaeis guineensis var. tenera TaxID=51953 RepID=A0A6I9QBA0_ELAGV|nr:transcription termination factor MTERF15, mitochondrial [Elaeis guineensis]XP_029117031.1 transcription termination factor MTERF15, mitochondrial [Elaeis guineensis]
MLLPELSSSLRRNSANAFVAFYHGRRRRLLGDVLCLFSSTGTAATPKPHFMVDYLVDFCGFSPEKAVRDLKHVRSIKSPQQPNSVLDFFKRHGFDDPQIKKLISWHPRWLSLDVEKSLAPRFRALRDLGFSQSDIIHITLSNASILHLRLDTKLLPKIELWRSLLGSNDVLMKFIKRGLRLLCCSMEKCVLPNLSVLRDCGIPESKISVIVKQHPAVVVQRPASLQALIDRTEGLGIPRHSGMFGWALRVLCSVNEAKFKAKMEFMRTLGWSESEFLFAFRTTPSILGASKKSLQKKMEFWVKEAGCHPSYLAHHSVLLMCSLENRLIPRYRVMEILKSKGLCSDDCNLYTIMCLSEENFLKKFILRHKEEVPELCEMYAPCCNRSGTR